MAHELALRGDTSEVVMRFAPNPNGPPTLGHARGIIVNSELVRKYKGKLILRFDDTDPKTKKPLLEAYRWYLEDCKWLGFNPDQVVECSSRIPEYYKHAEQLIKLGKAYVCECPKERFKECRDGGRACPDRNKKPEENLGGWKKMLSGGYEEGHAVLRIKTELNAPNPAERDWVAFRVVKEPHPVVGSKYNAWPMLDFAGAIEDHLQGVTHIIRGKDLADSEKRQLYVYDYLSWKYPEVTHWGRIKVAEEEHWDRIRVAGEKVVYMPNQSNLTAGESQSDGSLVDISNQSNAAGGIQSDDTTVYIPDQSNLAAGEIQSDDTDTVTITKLSTSATAKAIGEGLYTGWDDPQLYTLMALRRRGITAEAIRNLMLSLGLSESDISLSMENLYSENRKILDEKVNRYFFVEDPVEVVLENPPLKTVRIALHPSFKERGVREQTLKLDKDGRATVLISKKDAQLLEKEGSVKLIGLPCIQKKDLKENLTTVCLLERKDAKMAQAQKIHWVQDYVKAEILMNDRPSNEPKRGYCEKTCLNLKEGDIIQFERFGFCRLDKKHGEKLVFCYGHQ